MPAQNNDFVGRQKELEDIDNAFFKDNIKLLLITSTEQAKSGKTALANAYCFRFNEQDNLNNYVYCWKADENNLYVEFKEIAINLDIIDLEKKKIEELSKNTDSFLIPTDINSKTLNIEPYQIKKLNKDECVTFMKSRINRQKDKVSDFLGLFVEDTEFNTEILIKFAEAINADRANPLSSIIKNIDNMKKFQNIITHYGLKKK